MKTIISLILSLLFVFPQAETNSYEDEIKAYQNELNEFYKNKDTSPLPKKDRKKFEGHRFYPINEAYRVKAHFVRSDDPGTFQMKTSSEKLKTYDVYAKAIFKLNDSIYTLNIYQSHRLREMDQYKDHLFLPFTDATSGGETYGGGRYLDLNIPDGDSIVLDFNKAYYPYCRYTSGYSCPIPPAENDLNTAIEAGIKN